MSNILIGDREFSLDEETSFYIKTAFFPDELRDVDIMHSEVLEILSDAEFVTLEGNVPFNGYMSLVYRSGDADELINVKMVAVSKYATLPPGQRYIYLGVCDVGRGNLRYNRYVYLYHV